MALIAAVSQSRGKEKRPVTVSQKPSAVKERFDSVAREKSKVGNNAAASGKRPDHCPAPMRAG
jgi:hypothetical protein